jgi:hypothetical protein
MTTKSAGADAVGAGNEIMKWMLSTVLSVLVVLSCMATAPTVQAGSLLVHSRAIVRPEEQNVDNTQTSGIATVQAQLDVSGNLADAQAESRFGLNSTFARVSTVQGASSNAFAAAASYWQDSFTITDPAASPGAILTATVGAQLHGTLNASAPGFTEVSFSLVYDLEGQTPFGSSAAAYSRALSADEIFFEVDEFVSLTFQFENGVPFDFMGQLETVAITELGVPTGIEVDFRDTAIVTFIDLPPGATLVSESGQVYPLTIPEPSPLVLNCISIFIVLAVICRRSGQTA